MPEALRSMIAVSGTLGHTDDREATRAHEILCGRTYADTGPIRAQGLNQILAKPRGPFRAFCTTREVG